MEADPPKIRTLRGHTGYVTVVAVTPDGRRAVSGSEDGTLQLWDLESGQTIHTLQGHMGGVYAVAITPDGRRAVSGSLDQTLRLWDLESGQAVRTLKGHQSSAMNNLGELCYYGHGVAQDYGKAREWYQKGADAGNIAAKGALARLRQK